MKRNWQPEQLIEHWTLLPSEFELLNNKTSTNRLAIALLLKYFQYEGRFPTSKSEIPQDAIIYVAQLLKVNPKRLEQYNWQSRTVKHHRAIIREFLGITEATVEDGDALTEWLETQVLAYDLKFESLPAPFVFLLSPTEASLIRTLPPLASSFLPFPLASSSLLFRGRVPVVPRSVVPPHNDRLQLQ